MRTKHTRRNIDTIEIVKLNQIDLTENSLRKKKSELKMLQSHFFSYFYLFAYFFTDGKFLGRKKNYLNVFFYLRLAYVAYKDIFRLIEIKLNKIKKNIHTHTNLR